jgi:hypothetical protein
MSQLAVSEGQPGNWEEPDLFLRRLETVRFQENGWQEPDESRDSCPILWGPGGEIPLGYPTCARHGAQHRNECCQPVSESELGSDLGVEVPWRPW